MINVRSIIDDLMCSVCLDFFSDPRTLSCQHSFCFDCLKPLIKERVFNCPQCRKCTYADGVENLPRNILLENLINTVNVSSKVACPKCKKHRELSVCEHCSEIFCDDCNQDHLKSSLNNVNSRVSKIESTLNSFESMKASISQQEQESYRQVVREMDAIQAKIFSVWQAKKFSLINEVHQFYRTKIEKIELSEFRSKIYEKSLKEILDAESETKKKLNEKRKSSALKELFELENKLDKLEFEIKLTNENFGKNDFNTQIKLKYDDFDSFDVFKQILGGALMVIDNSEKKEKLIEFPNQKNENSIIVKDWFGNSSSIRMGSECKTSVRSLKEKAKFLFGVNSEEIDFKDRNSLRTLDDDVQLSLKDGRVYKETTMSKVTSQNSPKLKEDKTTKENNEEDELDLIISFKSKIFA